MHEAQRLINHVALVLDGSSSMYEHRSNLIKVADEQIQHLAQRSEEMQQETRVSVYLFNQFVECLIFDMDVMRLPSIADLYTVSGMTALVDAVFKSQEDLQTTSQIYGDHAFLTFVLTDGQENRSRRSWTGLRPLIDNTRENWTVGFLVPDRSGKQYVQRIGGHEGNIAIWDTSSAAGLSESFSAIRSATDNFMTARSQGQRGTRNVFSTGTDAVNVQTVHGTLTEVTPKALIDVDRKDNIRDFVNSKGHTFNVGRGYYQLTKSEKIQASKNLLVREKVTGKIFGGDEARNMVGLPVGREVRVRPDTNNQYEIFVQSTSWNRLLVPGTKLVLV